MPTLPDVGTTLTTCGVIQKLLLAIETPLTVIVVVPYRWTSTVHVVENDPKLLATVVVMLLLVPNITVTASLAPYPVPLMVTTVPTVPAVGWTLTTCGRITNVLLAVPAALLFAVMVVVPYF